MTAGEGKDTPGSDMVPCMTDWTKTKPHMSPPIHPYRHIIEFIGYGCSDSSSEDAANQSLFLVEEFVDGGTLQALVGKQQLLTQHLYHTRDAVRWLIGIARGLKYLHQREPMVRGGRGAGSSRIYRSM